MEATMGYRARQEFFRTQRKRYFEANRAGKERILDEAGAMFALHRKSLVRAFARAVPAGDPPRRGTPARYGPEHLRPLKALWKRTGQICSKRLAAALPDWLPFYEKHEGALAPKVRGALL